jgi:hypothetical protein
MQRIIGPYIVQRGHAVAQLETLRHKPEGRVSLEFLIDIILPADYGPGVDSASNRNEYQEYFLGGKGGRFVGLTTLPPSCGDCREIWEPQPPGTLRACPGLYWDCFTCTYYRGWCRRGRTLISKDTAI